MPLCLIVDDSKVVRKLARRMIEPSGFSIEEAENGKEALAKCKITMPNFILLDWNMPEMNGMEFLKQFRTMHRNESARVIFCTTETDVAHITQAIEAGADEYVMKPFDEAILLDKMTQVGLL